MRSPYLLLLSAVALMTSCNSGSSTISGKFVGNEHSWIYLKKVGSSVEMVDSIKSDERGKFSLSFKEPSAEPTLYQLSTGGQEIPLFVMEGDHIKVQSLGRLAHNYTVQGSDESELLRQFYQKYIIHKRTLEGLANRYADKNNSDEEREKAAKKYSDEYRATKRAQLRFIIQNKASLAAIYALYQRLPGDEYLFNAMSDVIYMRDVAQAVELSYPNASLLRSLQSDIEQAEMGLNLNSKVSYRNYPELNLRDIYGKQISLSSLDGKVVLVSFYSPEQRNSTLNNIELKELYKKYNQAGLEIYQVAIESSKSRWIKTINEQHLPWISVSDLLGSQSPTIGLYNVTQLPANYLIGGSGTIVGFNLTGEELDEMVSQEVAKNK